MFDCVRLSTRQGRRCQASGGGGSRHGGGSAWPSNPGRPGAASCSFGRARGSSARRPRSTRRSSTRSSRRRSARRWRSACSGPCRPSRGADPVWATIIAVVLNIPVLIMMALLASSMPRTGGDYVWVSRILSPPLAMVSNFGAALSAMIGATFWARFFPVFALGPGPRVARRHLRQRHAGRVGHQLPDRQTVWIFVGGAGDDRR